MKFYCPQEEQGQTIFLAHYPELSLIWSLHQHSGPIEMDEATFLATKLWL